MKLLVLVPKIVKNFVARFPEVQHNAYNYFNYDNRIVDERVDRHDGKAPYKGPDNFTDTDYNQLIVYAKTLLNPVLLKYSQKVACEDALNTAIYSYNNGLFNGKVNAGRFDILLKGLQASLVSVMPVMAKKKEEAPAEKTVVVKPHTLKQLGLTPKQIPMKQRVRQRQKGIPMIVKEKGKIVKK